MRLCIAFRSTLQREKKTPCSLGFQIIEDAINWCAFGEKLKPLLFRFVCLSHLVTPYLSLSASPFLCTVHFERLAGQAALTAVIFDNALCNSVN